MSGALIVGAGLVGSFSARALRREECDVALVDPDPDPDYIRRAAGDQCSIVAADACDRKLVEGALASYRPDVVIWAAGPSGGNAQANAVEFQRLNVTAPLHVAEVALAAGVRRFVYVSSFAVYGSVRTDRACEDHEPSPASTYGRAKLAGERALAVLRRDGLDLRILRPCGLYGPLRNGRGSRSARLVATLVAAAVERRSVALPFSVADELLYAKDIGRAVALAALRDYDGEDAVFNVGSGRHVWVEDIVAALRTILSGTEISLTSRMQKVAASIPPLDVSKIRDAFGFEPEYDLDAALRDYLREVAVAA